MSAGISWRTILLKMVSLMPAPSMLRINHVDSIQQLPAAERVCQRAAVDVFKLAAQGYAISQPGRSHAPCPRQLRQVVCRGVALHRGIGGNDQLLDLALAQALGQLGQTQLFRPQSVQRRQATHQHEILAAVTGGLLDRRQLGRRLHHAHHLTIAAAAGAKRAHRILAEVAAALAVADPLHRLGHHAGEFQPALALALEQMERHPLRTLAAHARQTAQCFDEFGKERGAGHWFLSGNGESGIGNRKIKSRYLALCVLAIPDSPFPASKRCMMFRNPSLFGQSVERLSLVSMPEWGWLLKYELEKGH